MTRVGGRKRTHVQRAKGKKESRKKEGRLHHGARHPELRMWGLQARRHQVKPWALELTAPLLFLKGKCWDTGRGTSSWGTFLVASSKRYRQCLGSTISAWAQRCSPENQTSSSSTNILQEAAVFQALQPTGPLH